MPNVVETAVFSFREKIKHDELVFTCVAHWTLPKRPDLIFRSLEKFSSGKRIVLNIVGECLYVGSVKKIMGLP